jgi:catalase
MPVSAEDAVNAINGVFGFHAGARAAHARGTVCRGTFTPTAEAATLTSAAHMREPVDVTVRFSNGSGDPGTSDREPDVRGMAVRFYLPDGKQTDVVANTLPCFFVSNLEDFVELNRLLRRRKGKPPSKLGALIRIAPFYLRHKAYRPALRATIRPKSVPSYANCRFNSIHAFKWVKDGSERYVRYSWRPEEGEKTGVPTDASHDYLQKDLYDRLGRAPIRPIRFTLELQVASDDDFRSGRVCDPTAIWPGKRKDKPRITPAGGGERCEQFVDAGLLEVTALAEPEKPNEPLLFDPMALTNGIEAPVLNGGVQPSRDEILHFRPGAYDVSADRRKDPAEKDRR